MVEPISVRPVTPSVEDPATGDDPREDLVLEVAEDARKAPQEWLEEAEVPKGGE